jgi:hypothetical protein
LKSKKHPARGFEPSSEKTPRTRAPIDQIKDLPVAWHIKSLDRAGPWCWKNIDDATLWSDIHSKLANFETMKWSEILGPRHHETRKDQLIPEARSRLAEIKQDDVDILISLHLEGKKIIWGIRENNILKILWWDPKHEICPSPKKHT